MKKISILGSTGSIGTQALDVIRKNPSMFSVSSLTAHSNIDLLASQVREFHPTFVALSDASKYKELQRKIGNCCEIGVGQESLVAAAQTDCDMVLSAIVGIAGLAPTFAAIESGKNIALANKETMVTGGRLITDAIQKKNITIVPVDSEHSAIFQSIGNNRHEEIHKLIITASGGPFRDYSPEMLQDVTLEDALKHPNWSMGRKITIDSATMMNKGLEVIEARWLFHIAPDRIEPVIHRQSIVHSLVEFIDGAVIGQFGIPDMKLPIQYAFTYPERISMDQPRLSLSEIGTLTFEAPNYELFPCLKLAFQCLKQGDAACIVLNGANEIAVNLFLERKISFMDIARLVEQTLEALPMQEVTSLEHIFEIDRLSRQKCMEIYEMR